MSSSPVRRTSFRPAPPAARTPAPSRVSTPVSALLALGFLGAHVPLALLMRSQPAISTLHALVTVALGLAWAVSGKHPQRVACVAAYLAGSEVLWRMTGADFFWEGAKYGTVLILAVAMIRSGRFRGPLPIAGYFLLLLPSTALVWMQIPAFQARNVTSFNLSGPLALAVAAWFFANLRLSREGISRVLFALAAPIVGVLTASFFGTMTAQDLSFGGGSNFATSGGFGPNQVSAVLGLGALAAFILALDHGLPLLLRTAMLGLLLAFAAQSALTFSRTGVAALIVCGGVGTFFLLRSPRARASLAIGLPILAAAAILVIVPRLESMTGGAIGDRFSDASPTGRDQLAKADWLIFLDHPILGVGPGQAKALRGVAGRIGLSHTEFTRLLSEHGSLGLLALLLLVVTGARRFLAARGASERAIVAMLYTWSALFMLVSGMRLVAPAFAFGLASAMPPRGRKRRGSEPSSRPSGAERLFRGRLAPVPGAAKATLPAR